MLNRRLAMAIIFLGLACAMDGLGRTAWAQSSEQGDPLPLAIKGYDPVAYFTEGRPIHGSAEFEIAFDEARYRFSSAEHLASFRDEPDRYIPQFAGACASGVSMGVKVEADPQNWLIDDGRLFVFSSPAARQRFEADPEELSAAATANWLELRSEPWGARLP